MMLKLAHFGVYLALFALAPSVSAAVLTVERNGSGSGTVTSAPAGIACGTDCDHDYPTGTTVTLTPTADSESTFTGWDGVACEPGSCTFVMQFSGRVTATFDLVAQGSTNPGDSSTTPGNTIGIPDLSGTITKTTVRVKSAGHKLVVKQEICNEGDGAAGPFTLALFLSSDAAWSDDDELLQSLVIDSLDPTVCIRTDGNELKFKAKGLTALDGKHAVVVIDRGEEVTAETNTTNNVLSVELHGPFLSSGARTPGQFLTVVDESITAGSSVEVTFSGPDGYVVTTTTDLTMAGQAKVAVPPFVDLNTNDFTAGVVDVSISDVSRGATLKIKALPELDAEPGAVTREMIKFTLDNLASGRTRIETASAETGQDVSEWLESIDKIRTAFEGMDNDLASQQLTLATDSDSAVFGPEDLQVVDRLVAAHILGLVEELEGIEVQALVTEAVVEQSSRRAQTGKRNPTLESIANGLQRVKKTSLAGIQFIGSYVSVTAGTVGLVSAAVPGGQPLAAVAGATALASTGVVTIGAAAVSVILDGATILVIKADRNSSDAEIEDIDVSKNALDQVKGGLKSIALTVAGGINWFGAKAIDLIGLADDTKSGIDALREVQQCQGSNQLRSPNVAESAKSALGDFCPAPTSPDEAELPSTASGTLDISVSIPGFSITFTPSVILGTSQAEFNGEITITNLPAIEAIEGQNDPANFEVMGLILDSRVITGAGDYRLGTISNTFIDQVVQGALTFATMNITDVSEEDEPLGVPVVFESIDGTLTLSVYEPGSGGRIAGSFVATIQGEQVIDLTEDGEAIVTTLTGTIVGDFDVPVM